jgi:hypothetical protein
MSIHNYPIVKVLIVKKNNKNKHNEYLNGGKNKNESINLIDELIKANEKT